MASDFAAAFLGFGASRGRTEAGCRASLVATNDELSMLSSRIYGLALTVD
jgi:N-acetylglucosamine-6-phosphate deacetylase